MGNVSWFEGNEEPPHAPIQGHICPLLVGMSAPKLGETNRNKFKQKILNHQMSVIPIPLKKKKNH